MEPVPKPEDLQPTQQARKGCHISIMFPVEDDQEAFVIKKAIDKCVPDVEGRRYTFQITEM